MKQPIKGSKKPLKKNKTKSPSTKRNHPQYGTSKLEEDFAREFLDKLGIEYIYQFEAKDIKRFYDFYLPQHNLLVEIDGDFWHGNPDKYQENELKGHQKRAQRVDEYKNKWALLHGIPLLRIWESDIRKNPTRVMKMLKEELNIQDKKRLMNEDRKKRH